MTSRLLSFVIWAAVAASAAFWGMRLLARPAAVPAHASMAVQPPAQGGDLTRLFGAPAPVQVAAAPVVPVDSRFKLLGVVAPTAGQHAGLALIAVDGRAARPVAVGGRVDGDLVLRSVSHRRAELGAGNGPASVVLELAAVPEAARGSLPPPVLGDGGAPPMPAPAMVPQGQPPMVLPTHRPPQVPTIPTPAAQAPVMPFGNMPAQPAAADHATQQR